MPEGFELLQSKLEDWLDALITGVPNATLALLIALAAWVLARVAGRLVDRVLSRISQHAIVTRLVSLTVSWSILVAGLIIALGALNLDKTVTSLLAGAGIVTLILGLAFQSVATNLIAGIIITVRKPFVAGDLIETSEHVGRVQQLNLRATVLRTLDGVLVYVPNSSVLEDPIINYSATGVRRLDLGIGISYGEKLDRVKEVTLDAVQGIPGRLAEREPELFFEGFGDSSINFEIQVWIHFRDQRDYLAARSEAVMRIKAAYDAAGITIPFPIRTLDFGIKGGRRLSEELP
jgi:small conductance mechanosensitive channel